MWREPRWIAILLILAMQCECASYAANVRSKRVSSTQDIQVLSATHDSASNFVLLNTQKSRQLSFPTINYLPAANGRAVMTVDFAGATFSQEQAVFNFDQSAIKQVRVGQLQSYPPIMRVSMLAEHKDAFGKVDFRSSPGALTIKLPHAIEMQTISEAPKPAPAIMQKTYDKVPSVAPQIVKRTQPVQPSAQVVPDAQYIAMEEQPERGGALRKGKADAPSAVRKRTGADGPSALQERGPTAVQPRADGPSALQARKKRPLWKRWLLPESSDSKDEEPAPESAPAPKVAPQVVQQTPPPKTAKAQPSAKQSATEQQKTQSPPVTSTDSVIVSTSGSDPLCVKVAASKPFTFNTFRLRDPDRLVVDIKGLQPSPITSAPEILESPIVRGFRFGSPQGQPEITRVVVDLVDDNVVVNEAQEAEILSLQLQRSTTTTARPGIDPRQIRCDGLIVLDAGHGGSDPGAQRGDVQEKELTMQIVAKLRKQLEARGLRVRLTRADDTYISLEDRVKITNATQPDAFVSVHINSLETNNQINGVETYYQNEQSKDLAQLIHNSLVSGLGVPDRSVRKARFYVINHTPVPAVLAEVGFISNKDERDKLVSSDYQKQIAASLADGVMLFLSERKGINPLATNQQSSRSGTGSGTISTAAPSASGQSLTQNLHSPKPKNTAEKLQFKKRGVAATRSLN
jgi:N-acetylmuramoyl-L-alanine amidase